MQAWTTLKLLEWTADFFEKKGVPNSRLDAELLLAHCLGCARIDLYTKYNKPVQLKELDRFRPLVERRATREPLQYIVGETEFYGHRIKVTPDVLIPRSETEQLVEVAAACLLAGPVATQLSGCVRNTDGPDSARATRYNVLDIGTGSACIAIAMARQLDTIHVTATDRSATALAVAAENVRAHELDDRITLLEADLIPSEIQQTFDVVVSNPPYIARTELDGLQPEVSQFEPRAALDGGPDGLDHYRRLAATLHTVLALGAVFVGEIGDTQADALREIFGTQEWCTDITIKQDLASKDRILIAQSRPLR